MSSSTIDLKLNIAKKQSEVLYKRNPSWQEKVDNLLDRMNILNGILTDLHSILLSVNFELERDFKGFRESEQAPKILLETTHFISKTLIIVRKSDLYPGIKTMFASLREENRYLRELLDDRNISIELEKDPESDNLMKAFIKASSN